MAGQLSCSEAQPHMYLDKQTVMQPWKDSKRHSWRQAELEGWDSKERIGHQAVRQRDGCQNEEWIQKRTNSNAR